MTGEQTAATLLAALGVALIGLAAYHFEPFLALLVAGVACMVVARGVVSR